ncbi:hypothetical protein C8Q74DRAFT_1441996 [Fomes fomentarius]|nr:hypothetical protein C8Q74DRAFT_1441996 [Fomes fomentarius]
MAYEPANYPEGLEERLDKFREEVFSPQQESPQVDASPIHHNPTPLLTSNLPSRSHTSFRSRVARTAHAQTAKVQSAVKKADNMHSIFPRLSGLGKLPLEMFYEVSGAITVTPAYAEVTIPMARYLEPIDLLYLAQTLKWLREVLLSIKNRRLWQISMANLRTTGFPNVPDDLCEPEYTALVFDTHCFVEYALRIRFCEECYSENVVEASEVVGGALPALQDMVVALIPAVSKSLVQWRRKPCQRRFVMFTLMTNPLSHMVEDCCLKSDLVTTMSMLSSLPPGTDWNTLSELMKERINNVLERQVDAMLLEWWEDTISRTERDFLVMSVALNHLIKRGCIRKGSATEHEWRVMMHSGSRDEALRLKPYEQIRHEGNLKYDREAAAYERRYEQRLSKLQDYYARFVQTSCGECEDLELYPNNAYASANFFRHLAEANYARGDMGREFDLDTLRHADRISREIEKYVECVKQAFAALVLLNSPNQDAHADTLSNMATDQAYGSDYLSSATLDALSRTVDGTLSRADALFVCDLCPAHASEMHTFNTYKLPSTLDLEDEDDYEYVSLPRCTYWTEAKTLVPRLLPAIGLPHHTDMSELDDLLASARLTCTCGDPSLPGSSELNWAQFVYHVYQHSVWYQQRLDMRLRDADAVVILNDDHADLSKCIRWSRRKATRTHDVALFDHHVRADPYTRARINAHLATAPEGHEPFCRVCESMTLARSRSRDATLVLKGRADDIVYHMRAKFLLLGIRGCFARRMCALGRLSIPSLTR